MYASSNHIYSYTTCADQLSWKLPNTGRSQVRCPVCNNLNILDERHEEVNYRAGKEVSVAGTVDVCCVCRCVFNPFSLDLNML